MSVDTAAFYDDLAEHYHLIYEDWDHSIDRQASVLGTMRLDIEPMKRKKLSESLKSGGLSQIEWLMPQSTSFYQPIVVAPKEAR